MANEPAHKMRFGAFIAPFHALDENPTLAIERDLELVEWLDRLGYDEAWIGEHHSGGFELIASPELFIATIAERTKNICLGTGVSSLPYHHPLMLADRINQLDHITKGRVMFGVGPGALPTDAYMMGIEPARQRDMMLEAIEVLIPLLSGETVNQETDWFTLKEARLQMEPYTKPHVEMAVASQVSPAGARAAGRFGLSLLSLGATTTGGFDALHSNWNICEDMAKDYGQTADRKNWRLVGPMHIAETREKALENVKYGLHKWLAYFQEVGALPVVPDRNATDPVDIMISTGMAVVGTPDDAIAQLKRLEEQSQGGFGAFLHMANNWADFEQTKRSYELFARYVMPEFQNIGSAKRESYNWARDNHDKFLATAGRAVGNEIAKHMEEKGDENINPGLAKAIKKARQSD